MRLEDMSVSYFDTMLRVRKGYARVLEPICRRWNLTRNELDVLLFLANNPKFDRAADIVTRRGLSKSHVSLSVTNLEARGLLLRQPDAQDRRTVHLKLSEEAKEIARVGRNAQVEFFSGVYEGMTQEEVELGKRVVERVSKNAKKMNL